MPMPLPIAPRTVAIPVELQELAVLAARHPRLAVRVEIQRAHQISHLHRLEELAVAGIDDDPILLAVADPDIAVVGIDGEPVGRAEFSLPDLVAVPLIDELAVLVEVDDPRRADVVGRDRPNRCRWGSRSHDPRRYRHRRSARTPPSPAATAAAVLWLRSSRRGVPRAPIVISSLPSGLIFITVAPFAAVDPDVVLRIDGHAVRLVLVADHVVRRPAGSACRFGSNLNSCGLPAAAR